MHHHHNDYVEVISAKGPTSLSTRMKVIFTLMMILGFGALLVASIFTDRPRIVWIPFLHNLYFFTGLSAAGVVIAAIIHVTRAYWGRPIKRFAEATGAFLPFSIAGLLILYFGADSIYEWITYPPDPELYHNKHIWLQKNFMFGRQIVVLLILAFLAHRFASFSTRPDLGLAHEKNPDLWKQPDRWRGLELEVARSQRGQAVYGVLYCFAYAFGISLMAYDLIMSLDFRWVSTMFGGWNFTTFLLLGWGSMVIITHFMSRRFQLEGYMHRLLYHDLGKLTFGFTIIWGYLFFAQYLVIWYGNLSHEAGYLMTRFFGETWRPFSLVTFALVFLLPFILGLSKNLKMSPKTFAPVVLISFIGIWLERFVLIAPASWYYDRHAETYSSGIGLLLFMDVLVFLGFFGLFAMVFSRYLYKRPVMVISDPKLDGGIHRH